MIQNTSALCLVLATINRIEAGTTGGYVAAANEANYAEPTPCPSKVDTGGEVDTTTYPGTDTGNEVVTTDAYATPYPTSVSTETGNEGEEETPYGDDLECDDDKEEGPCPDEGYPIAGIPEPTGEPTDKVAPATGTDGTGDGAGTATGLQAPGLLGDGDKSDDTDMLAGEVEEDESSSSSLSASITVVLMVGSMVFFL